MSSSTNTLGKYQIIREIGRSNDIVYEAIDPSINRRIALKELFLAPNLTPAQRRERIERFHREGRAAGRLTHPNIVTIYEVGQEGDRYFIAMEFLEGQTLRDVIQMRGALPIKEATDIALQILNGLSYAHLNGVVHRDIKPENIQILPGGLVKITDFGIARLMGESSITVDGQVFGTPSYMSPEQVEGKQIDQRSDLFSLGVMLYEMLAGRKPFSGDSVVTITYNIMHREPTPLPGVPQYLTSIIGKAMSKEPDQRYSSADEFADDLRNERSALGSALQPDPFTTISPAPPGSTAYPGPMMPPPPSSTGFPPPPGGSSHPGPPPSQSAPDPFASAPSAPYTPPAPKMPRPPIVSPETANFIGILALVIGLTGMFILSLFAVTKAYKAWEQGISSKQAQTYYEQGRKLYMQGRYDDAADQFRNAVRVAGTGPMAKVARESLSATYVNLGVRQLQAGDVASAAASAEQALAADGSSAAAHLLSGTVHSHRGESDKAMEEWRAAVQADPTSEEAKRAREYIGGVYYNQGVAYANAGQMDQAKECWERVVQECAGSEVALLAQQRIDEAMGISR